MKLKKRFYILSFTVLGILLTMLLHAIIEILYVDRLVSDFETYSLGLSWANWFFIHYIFSVSLSLFGAVLGYIQGIYWWHIMYETNYLVEKSHRGLKNFISIVFLIALVIFAYVLTTAETDDIYVIDNTIINDGIKQDIILDSTSDEDSGVAVKKNSDSDIVYVKDQPAGKEIFISNLNLKAQRWIVIYEDNNGEAGNILGAGRFNKDEKSGTVELLRGTISNNIYYVIVHTDDGDGKFDFNKDVPLIIEGKSLETEFRAL